MLEIYSFLPEDEQQLTCIWPESESMPSKSRTRILSEIYTVKTRGWRHLGEVGQHLGPGILVCISTSTTKVGGSQVALSLCASDSSLIKRRWQQRVYLGFKKTSRQCLVFSKGSGSIDWDCCGGGVTPVKRAVVASILNGAASWKGDQNSRFAWY